MTARVHTDFAGAFTPGSRFRSQSGAEKLASIRAGGELAVAQGSIAFGDLFDLSEMKTFARAIPAGRYPLELAVCADTEPAATRLRFLNAPAARWEPALSKGDDLDDLRPGEFFGAVVGNGTIGAFADTRSLEAMKDAEFDPIDLECFAHCLTLAGDHQVAVFSTNGPGMYAAYWGFTDRGELAELVVDLNGFLENDYVELMLDVQGDVPRRVKLPALKSPVGDVRIIERKTHLVIEVAKKQNSRLGLRGYSAASADERVSRYEFERDVTSVKAVVHFGLKRMERLG